MHLLRQRKNKSLKNFTIISLSHCNNGKNLAVIRDPKTSYCVIIFLILIGLKINKNLKPEIEFVIKSNESLAENKI